MKRILKCFFILIIGMIFLYGCDNTKNIKNYYIGTDGELYAVLKDGKEKSLGSWGENIISSFESISISDDGFFIINGIKSSINDTVPLTYFLDKGGKLNAKYADGTVRLLGNFNKDIVESLGNVTISNDGYYVINGIKTKITAKVPASYFIQYGHLIVEYTDNTKKDLGDFNEEIIKSFGEVLISEDNYYVINGIKTEIKAKTITGYKISDDDHLIVIYDDLSEEDLGDASEYLFSGVKTIAISDDGYYIVNGILTNIEAYNLFSVVFDTLCDIEIPTQSLRNGSKASEPTIEREGYDFLGWYLDDTLWSFDNTVTKDITLKASWSGKKYKVSFYNEKGASPSSIDVVYGALCMLPKLDSISGYTFDGWYYGNEKVLSSKWAIASDATLTAKWIQTVTSKDETYDLISISDLNFNGQTNMMSIKDNTNITGSYKLKDIEGSLVLRIYYDIVDDTKKEGNSFRIHFDVSDDIWDVSNCLWIRGDGNFMAKYDKASNSFVLNPTSAASKGAHIIEFGRIAILEDGAPSGNYYVYYKVDGVLMDSCTNPYNRAKMDGDIFFNFSALNTKNKIYDIKRVPGFEDADIISINDLFKDDILIQNELSLNDTNIYSYISTKDHNSFTFKFLYDVLDYQNIDTSFRFSDSLTKDDNDVSIHFMNNKISINQGETILADALPLSNNGLYEVEIGKLYISSGDNSGKYNIYLNINGEKILEYMLDFIDSSENIVIESNTSDILYDINYVPFVVDASLFTSSNIDETGIIITANVRKDFKELQNISEVGFIIYPIDDSLFITKKALKLEDNGGTYRANLILNSLYQNPTRKYVIKLYYITVDKMGVMKTVYKDYIIKSLLDVIGDTSLLDEPLKTPLENLKNSVLCITLDENTCEVLGASIKGSFDSNIIELTPSKEYDIYLLNDELIYDGATIKIGFIPYSVEINDSIISLTKQEKEMIYGGSEHFHELNSGHADKINASALALITNEIGRKKVIHFSFILIYISGLIGIFG